ncbi:MAG: hypothetical protein AAFW75_06295 [Cyanobacteria bacterium J06636_16]
MSRFESSESQSLLSKIRNPKGRIGKFLKASAPVWGFPLAAFRPGNVAMFHMGRCGSSVLGDLLNQHPKMYWGGEIYTPSIRSWRQQKHYKLQVEGATLQPDAFKILQRDMLVAGSKYYGCEVKFHHLTEGQIAIADYVNHLKQRNFKFITLVRKNFLRSIVSNTVMFSSAKTKTHNRADEKAVLTKVTLDIGEARYNGYKKPLIEHLRTHQKNFSDFEAMSSAQNILKLTYEDNIFSNPSDAYLKTCEFLSLEPCDLKIRLKKTNPFPLSEIITNYEEVKSYLSDTEFAWMCES